MEDVIAQREVICVNPDGSQSESSVQIGRPFYSVERKEWVCAVGVRGIYEKRAVVTGPDSFQVLLLALRLARQLLEFYVDDGGQIISPQDGNPVDIDHMFRINVVRV